MNIKNVTAVWTRLTGKAGEASLEARIYHAVCVISIILLGFTAIFNYLIGIRELELLMLSVFILTCFFFYISRIKKQLNNSIALFSLTCNALFVVNFFYNSGIDGPTLLIFILSFFLTIAIVPKKQYGFWIALNIVVVLGLLATGYLFPQWVTHTYNDTASRYLDFGYTYVIIVVLVFLVTNTIRKNYIIEKNLAEQKARELEASNETKNKLFSILAHDLRSPLSSIQNFLEILSEYKLEESEKQTIQKALLVETQNTQQMLSNLLSWSKEQMDGVKVNLTSLNLVDTLRNTLLIQQTAATEKCIRLTNQMDTSVCVVADVDMLQLVVRNLINNAIKFTPHGGEIILSTLESGDSWRILVSDNGNGIAYEQQEGIFSLKAKSTFGTNNEKGIGLGLVLCKEFTELQGGTIGFQSIPGKGTTFFISLKQCKKLQAPTGKDPQTTGIGDLIA